MDPENLETKRVSATIGIALAHARLSELKVKSIANMAAANLNFGGREAEQFCKSVLKAYRDSRRRMEASDRTQRLRAG